MEFPYKTLVLTLVATLALAGVAWYAASVPVTDRLARFGVASILGGAIGNLIDRATVGYVLDYVDVYYRGWHFWAFNVADAAISDRCGVDDSRSPGAGTPCIQYCLSSGRSPSTRTACCWPPPICSACGWRRAARARRVSTATRSSTSASGSSSRALVGAKALLFVVDFRQFTSSWQDFTTLLRSGGVFYGGLIAAVVVCIYQLRKHKLPLWTSGDLFAPGIALGYMVGRLGCLAGGLLLRQADERAVGDHVHRPRCAAQRRHPAERAAPSDTALRVAGRVDHLRVAPRARATRPPVPRPDVLVCSCCCIPSRASSSSSSAATIAA